MGLKPAPSFQSAVAAAAMSAPRAKWPVRLSAIACNCSTLLITQGSSGLDGSPLAQAPCCAVPAGAAAVAEAGTALPVEPPGLESQAASASAQISNAPCRRNKPGFRLMKPFQSSRLRKCYQLVYRHLPWDILLPALRVELNRNTWWNILVPDWPTKYIMASGASIRR